MSSPHVCFADMPEYESRHRSRRQKQQQHNGIKKYANDENDENGDTYAVDTIKKESGIDSVGGDDGDGDDGNASAEDSHNHGRRCSSSKERWNISPNSISPTLQPATTATTPRYERNLGFFQQLSRRFGLRSNDDLIHYAVTAAEDDAHSSSTSDTHSSASSTVSATPPRRINNTMVSNTNNISNKDVLHGSSMEHISCASSETSSTIDIEDQQQEHRELEHHQHQQQENQLKPQQPIAPNAGGNKKSERKSISRSSFSRLHRRSTSSIRRAFESFSLSSRSLSCSGPTPSITAAVACQKNDTHTASNSNNSSYGGTPIKSALKSSSNVELNKRTAYFATSSSHSFSSTNSGGCNASSAGMKNGKTKAPPQRILRQPVSYTYLKGISGLPTQRVPRNSVCCQYARR